MLEGFPPARLSEESICLPCPTNGVWLGSTDRDSHCRVLRLGEEVLHTTSYCLLGRSSPYNLHLRSRHPFDHSVLNKVLKVPELSKSDFASLSSAPDHPTPVRRWRSGNIPIWRESRVHLPLTFCPS